MTAGDDASPRNGPGDRPGNGRPPGGGPGPELTLIVDGANVVGSRPDGWWRDRAGAAVRLHDKLAGLASRGATGIPAAQLTADGGDGPGGPGAAQGPSGPRPPVTVAVILVLEGAARAAVPRITERARMAARTAAAGAGSGRPGVADGGMVQVVSAPGSGDDEIVRLARARAGRCIVVTADRELRRRCVAAGANVAGPSWLQALL